MERDFLLVPENPKSCAWSKEESDTLLSGCSIPRNGVHSNLGDRKLPIPLL